MIFVLAMGMSAHAADPVGWAAFGAGLAGPPVVVGGLALLLGPMVGPPPDEARPQNWDEEAWRKSNRRLVATGLPVLGVGLAGMLAGPPVLLAQRQDGLPTQVGWGMYGAMWGVLGVSVALTVRNNEAPPSYWAVPVLYYGSLVAGAVALRKDSGDIPVETVIFRGVF